jgi:hypothetical protein
VIASLPMYDLPDCTAANDRYWELIRDAARDSGVNAPDALTRGMPDLLAHWQRPDLVLSQTCGFPFRAVLQGRVTLIGTPDFGLEGCPPGYYQSVLIVRSGDARDGLDGLPITMRCRNRGGLRHKPMQPSWDFNSGRP